MKSARRFYLLPLGLGAVGVLSSAIPLAVAARSLRPELPALEALTDACRQLVPLRASVPSLLVLLLATLGVIVFVRGARSLARHWRSQCQFGRALSVTGREMVGGTLVTWIEGARPSAFCAGLLSPRVHVSLGARDLLSSQQLDAVVAHERHHVRRRDPLRMLVVSVLAESLFFLPALPKLAARYSALAELAADEAAARTSGRTALASAMLAFGRRNEPTAVVGVTPERIDHLLGRRPEWQVPTGVLCASALALLGLLGLSITTEAVAGAADVGLVEAAVGACGLAMLAAPALALLMTVYLVRPLMVRRGAR